MLASTGAQRATTSERRPAPWRFPWTVSVKRVVSSHDRNLLRQPVVPLWSCDLTAPAAKSAQHPTPDPGTDRFLPDPCLCFFFLQHPLTWRLGQPCWQYYWGFSSSCSSSGSSAGRKRRRSTRRRRLPMRSGASSSSSRWRTEYIVIMPQVLINSSNDSVCVCGLIYFICMFVPVINVTQCRRLMDIWKSVKNIREGSFCWSEKHVQFSILSCKLSHY